MAKVLGLNRRGLLGIALVSSLIGICWALWVGLDASRRSDRLHAAQAAIARGRTHLQRGRPELAILAVEGVDGATRETAEVLTVRGLALAALDQPEAAQAVLEHSLELRPAQPMALKVLAATYIYENDIHRGLAALSAAAKLDPEDFRPWYAMGDANDQLGRAADAATCYREAMHRNPEDEETRFRLSAALVLSNASDEAAPLLERLTRERPGDVRVVTLAARHAMSLAKLEEAARLTERALALDPINLDALILRSQLNRRAGRNDLALVDIERAAELAPTNSEALYQLALVEAALGLKERAAATTARRQRLIDQTEQIRRLTDAVRASPKDPEPCWRLGQAALEMGAKSVAVRYFRAALDLDPNCRPALEGLAALGE